MNAFAIMAVFLMVGQAQPSDIKVMLDNVSEMRATGCCPSLTVELKLSGTDLRGILGVLPARLDTAQTDGGQDLRRTINAEQYLLLNEYKEVRGSQRQTVRINLEPSRRDAKNISLKGELPLFKPADGYKPVTVSEDVVAGSGKPIEHDALKQREISLVAFTKADYEKYMEGRKNASTNATAPLDALTKAFGEVIESLLSFGGGGDVVVLVSDPKDQLLAIRFAAADGSEFKSSGRSATYQSRSGKITYDFGGASLEGADITVDLVDSTQVITIPFEITADLP